MSRYSLFYSTLLLLFLASLFFKGNGSQISEEQNEGLFLPFKSITLANELDITPFFESNESTENDFSKLMMLAETAPKEEKNFTTKWFDAIDFVKFSVGNVTNMWGNIVNSFKTEKKSEVKQILSGKGFSYFSQSAQFRKSVGVKEEFYPKYKEMLLRSLEVPENRRQQFLDVLDTFEFSDEETWNAYETLFSINSQGECKYVFILANRNQTSNKFNIIYSDMKSTFKLAPDVMVIQQSNSYLGGIYSNSKLVFQDLPRGVTPEDLKAVYEFFYVVSFKNLADNLGIKVDLPKLN